MKITKKQLEQIIQSKVNYILKEYIETGNRSYTEDHIKRFIYLIQNSLRNIYNKREGGYYIDSITFNKTGRGKGEIEIEFTYEHDTYITVLIINEEDESGTLDNESNFLYFPLLNQKVDKITAMSGMNRISDPAIYKKLIKMIQMEMELTVQNEYE